MLLVRTRGTRLVTFREQMGLKQIELCRLAGINCKTLKKMEKGGRVKPASVRAVARVLGCNPHILAAPDDSRGDAAMTIGLA
jgi:transcriptional regulator with XRE-family HTH domain